MTAQRLAHVVESVRNAGLRVQLRSLHGHVEKITGSMIEAQIGGVSVGELCRIIPSAGPAVMAEVVGIDGMTAFLTPIGSVAGLSSSAEVEATGERMRVAVSLGLLGQVLDGLGHPLDQSGSPQTTAHEILVDRAAPSPLDRPRVERILSTGIRVVDSLLTCAEGQRIGIFGAAGSGKSSLIARLVRDADADVFVVALVGERGREVRDFVDRALGEKGRSRAVVVAATSDRPALERVKAAQVATTIAEWFRDEGRRVVLVVDSLTRLARAWREIGLAVGEPPTRRGYPPSVFAALPRLLERAASSSSGTITAFYTVLVEGELTSDPIAEEVKSILDGHVILSPQLAEQDHHPAIDVLASRSRVMADVVDPEHRKAAAKIRQLLSRHAEVEFLVRVGEYRAGADKLADEAIGKVEAIRGFLRQADIEVSPFKESLEKLQALAG